MCSLLRLINVGMVYYDYQLLLNVGFKALKKRKILGKSRKEISATIGSTIMVPLLH